MTVKLIILALSAFLGYVHSQGAKYPAGVDPHLCPNYPHCDNAALGAAASAAGAVAHAYAVPAYEEPSFHGYAAPAYASYGHSPAVPVSEGYPAGVNPHSCPNYPYCGPTPAHVPNKIWAGPSAHGYHTPAHNVIPATVPYAHGAAAEYRYASPAKGGDRYPAGVDPHSCPNYPYCH